MRLARLEPAPTVYSYVDFGAAGRASSILEPNCCLGAGFFGHLSLIAGVFKDSSDGLKVFARTAYEQHQLFVFWLCGF